MKIGTLRKRLFAQSALLFLAFAGAIAAGQAGNLIHWQDVTSGFSAGKYSHKYILADVYTDWCGWCKRLDRDTFSNPDLAHFLESKFVCVKANAEDNGAGQKLAGEYGVNGYPCALVFDAEGKLIGRVEAYKDAQAYEAALRNILDSQNK